MIIKLNILHTMIISEIIKKFIDFYNDFKHDGRLSIEQLVFAMDNFQKISFDIEDIAKVINNRDFGYYTQYNIIDFFNAVFNEQVYDLFLRDRREQKMCYWIINIEFYKIFNIYRILIMKANLLITTVKDSINEVTVKDFERTINIYIADGVSNIKKCLDYLKRNKCTKELVFCTKPFRNLVKMDEFGRMIFQRVFPNVDPDEFAKIYETDSDEEDDGELDPEVKMKLETVINNLARLNGHDNTALVDPIKKLVKEALRKAGIDIDLDTNTTITIGDKTIVSANNNQKQNQKQNQNQNQNQNSKNGNNMGMNMNMSNMQPTTSTAARTTLQNLTESQLQTMMAMQNMQAQMQNMMPKTTTKTQTTKNSTQGVNNDFDIVFSEHDREIEALLSGISASGTKKSGESNTQTKVAEPVKKETKGRKAKTVIEKMPLSQISSVIQTPLIPPSAIPALKARKSVKKTG